MGTSKGYIPPKSPHWSQAKGAVTRMSNGIYSSENAKKAISKFAEAYSTTHLPNSNVSAVAGGVINFLNSIRNSGLQETAKNFGLDSLLDKEGVILYQGIIDYFARDLSSIDGQIIRDSLSETLEEFEIKTFSDFSDVTSEEFLITFIVEFAIKNFEECFSEKILSNKENMSDYDLIIDNVSRIIENRIVTDMEINNALKIDYLSKEGQDYIKSVCTDCFNSLINIGEDYYEDMD
ncbi:MAG: hypothetical protein JL50_08710 [Peptococcaceae bacterium BICA1-7]|nr:MAG: hypothetical protein JL50_08710 [Peptococcaceae bacterium BICA1-7]HBV97355.1 hypothetical protein [Desulfotomaculum sp.]